MKVNTNYQNVNESYLFATIAKKTVEFAKANPNAKIIKMGIGDVTLPLCKAVIDAMHDAVSEMGVKETFKGYGEYQGCEFLQRAIGEYYLSKGVKLEVNEIFVSDGAKSDIGNVLDLFDKDNVVLIPDPVYPVYVDTNIMDGRKILFIDANEENDYLPLPDDAVKADLIYLCSPNNPTGACYSKKQLAAWVEYALKNDAIILFDAAYERFIADDDIPFSIFEIEGAKNCAIEICSFSKTAGFTGTRCGYTVVPNALVRGGQSINKMWLRRQSTKFNGVAYIVQRGAAAVFSDEGVKEITDNINYYRENALIICRTMDKLGIKYYGGKNSPYVWLKCPNGLGSWEFFDLLLSKANITGTPGAGFGKNGEGYFRLTSFSSRESTQEAMSRFEKLFTD